MKRGWPKGKKRGPRKSVFDGIKRGVGKDFFNSKIANADEITKKFSGLIKEEYNFWHTNEINWNYIEKIVNINGVVIGFATGREPVIIAYKENHENK